MPKAARGIGRKKRGRGLKQKPPMLLTNAKERLTFKL